MSKNKNLSVEDITIYKTRLQSFLNILPINGLYTDTTDGFHRIDKQSFENALKSGAVNQGHYEYYKSYMQEDNESSSPYLHFTLSSSPLSALKKIYYILEGDSINFKKCQQLEKEISDNSPKNVTSYEENPFELQLIEAQKQIEFFQNKLKNYVPNNKINKNKIEDIIQYYHQLIRGANDSDEVKFNGVMSNYGIKDEIKTWYDNKKNYVECARISNKLKISLDEAETLSNAHWDYMDIEIKKLLVEDDDDLNADEKLKVINSTYKEFEVYFPNKVKELLEFGVFGSDSSRQIVNEKEKAGSATNSSEDSGLFNINKIRELIFQNTRNDVEEVLSTTEMGETSSNISSEFEKHEPPKYDFGSHFEQNSIVHLSNTEKHIRKLIINQIYDCDINFLKKHFKQIWIDMENTKLRDGKNIQRPKEETELDYATFGQLLEILKNKETKNRVKIKNFESQENLIKKIEMILPYRNQLDHARGTINGDLHTNSKYIVVGICNEIDEFCSVILYQ